MKVSNSLSYDVEGHKKLSIYYYMSAILVAYLLNYMTGDVVLDYIYIPVLALSTLVNGCRIGIILSIFALSLEALGYWSGDRRVGSFEFVARTSVCFISTVSVIYIVGYTIGKYRSAVKVASIDGLTDSMNRSAIVGYLDETLKIGSRCKDIIVIAYIDIDGFKNVNDKYGHSAGDKILINFSSILRDSIRGSGSFGRMGGDEFLAVIRASSVESAKSLLHEMHDRFKLGLKYHNEGITCSVGAIITDGIQCSSCMYLINRADELMYAAKRNGRNKVFYSILLSLARRSKEAVDVSINWPSPSEGGDPFRSNELN